jgi:hypothetical protein
MEEINGIKELSEIEIINEYLKLDWKYIGFSTTQRRYDVNLFASVYFLGWLHDRKPIKPGINQSTNE